MTRLLLLLLTLLSSLSGPAMGANSDFCRTSPAAEGGVIQVTEASIAQALEGSTMQTVQGQVSLPAVQRYVRMLEEGKVAPAISVDGKVIVEGNHRYVAGRVFGTEPAVTPGTLSPSQVAKVRPIQDTIVDPTDWGNH